VLTTTPRKHIWKGAFNKQSKESLPNFEYTQGFIQAPFVTGGGATFPNVENYLKNL